MSFCSLQCCVAHVNILFFVEFSLKYNSQQRKQGENVDDEEHESLEEAIDQADSRAESDQLFEDEPVSLK